MKYYGKEKCKILKQIRAEIARQNDIEWVVSECQHQGNCRGTCPKCEAEVRQLERALARREALGKSVAVVGISAGIALSVTGCDISLMPSAPLSGDPLPPEQVQQTAVLGEIAPDTVEDTELSTEVLGGKPAWTEDEPLGGVPMPPEDDTDERDETDEWVEMGDVTEEWIIEPGEVLEGEPVADDWPETAVSDVMPDDWVESETESETETETFEDEIQIPHEE